MAYGIAPMCFIDASVTTSARISCFLSFRYCIFGISVFIPGVLLSPNMVPYSSMTMLLLYSTAYMFFPISDIPPNIRVLISPLLGFGINTFFGFFSGAVGFLLNFVCDLFLICLSVVAMMCC